MQRPRAWKLVLLGLASVTVAGAAVEGPVLVRRARRTRELKKAIEDLSKNGAEGRERLIGFAEPEALVALVGDWRKRSEMRGVAQLVHGEPPSLSPPEHLRRAVELFALEPEPRDPRPHDALEKLTHAPDRYELFWATYFIDELGSPRHAREPANFASPRAFVRARPHEALAQIRALTTLPITVPESMTKRWEADTALAEIDDTPWRALVRLAQLDHGRVAFESGEVKILREPRIVALRESVVPEGVPGPLERIRFERAYWEQDQPLVPLTLNAVAPAVFCSELPDTGGADPERALRVLESLDGLELRLTDEGDDERRFVARVRDVDRLIARIGDVAAGRTPAPRKRSREAYAAALLDFEDPDAFAALARAYLENARDLNGDAFERRLLESGILAATHRTSLPVREAAEELTRKGRTPLARFAGFYVLEELSEPSFASCPVDLLNAPPITIERGTVAEALTLVGHSGQMRVQAPDDFQRERTDGFRAGPWRALVRLAYEADARGWVVSRDEMVATVSRPKSDPLDRAWENIARDARVPDPLRRVLPQPPKVPDSRKGLRALAAVAGFQLVESPEGKLSLEPRAKHE